MRSQNLSLLSGAILRINPATGAAFSGNPLSVSSDPNTRRTVAKGFRNPFRFTFDPDTGEIYTGNVGSSQIEEIDSFQAPPPVLFNSGWPCYEGIQRQFLFRELNLDACNALYAGEPTSTSLPFFSYSHGQSVVPNDECPIESGSAVGGISFYEGDKFPAPAYKGALFFADAVRGCIWVMPPGADGKPDPSKTTRFLREGRVYPGVKIAEGPDGYLYYADLFSDEGLGAGAIHRVSYSLGAPTARLDAKPLSYGEVPLNVTFDASGSEDPSSEPLTYEWDLDGDGNFTAGDEEESKTFTKAELDDAKANGESGNRVVAVRVKDGTGLSSIARVTVYPGDKPPVPTITAPAPSFKWSVGSLIKLEADAVDAKGVPITTPLPYYWITRLAHCPNPANPTACHVHPLQTFSGIRRPEFVAPQHDYPSHIEVVLRVSDERGLSGATSMDIYPTTADLALTSDPPGIELTAGSTGGTTPFTAAAIEGLEIQLSAPPTAVVGGKTYTWQSWSDGEPRAHPVVIDGDAPYEAVFKVEDPDPGPGPDPDPDPGPKTDPGPGTDPTPIPPVLPLADTIAPTTRVLAHPARKTPRRAARFAFSSSESGGFYCKLDRRVFEPCASPRSYKGLKLGSHTFKVVATDVAGNFDPTPASFSWTVTPKPRR